MKTIGIVTINDLFNFGNRLQNYASYTVLSEYGKVENIATSDSLTCKEKIKYIVWKYFKNIVVIVKKNGYFRWYLSIDFSKRIHESNLSILDLNHIDKINYKYDKIFFGSDQIWNPEFNHLYAINPPTLKNKNYALAASIGVDEIAEKDVVFLQMGLINFLKFLLEKIKVQKLLRI